MAKPDTAPQTRRRKSLATRLRQLLWLLRTIDIDEIGEHVAAFDSRLKKVEQSQREVQAVLAEAGARINKLLELPDPRTILIALLDIKNLGYELGRALAEAKMAGRPAQPGQEQLRSKLCTQDDFGSDWLQFWCGELRLAPIYHRKIWELCYVAQALYAAGQLAPGRRGIGFGCGEEPLPSLFAKHGVEVVATDLDPDRPEAQVWRQTAQHAARVETLRRPEICADPQLLANISLETVDMNAIPRQFDGRFDFCWSTCALEHLGTIASGLNFIRNSLRTLRPGGVAVHTTEFTINEGETIDHHPIVLYQRRHLEALAEQLRAEGYTVADLDFDPGSGIMDRFVDLPPFGEHGLIGPEHSAHLRLLFDGYTCTSVGMIIRS